MSYESLRAPLQDFVDALQVLVLELEIQQQQDVFPASESHRTPAVRRVLSSARIVSDRLKELRRASPE